MNNFNEIEANKFRTIAILIRAFNACPKTYIIKSGVPFINYDAFKKKFTELLKMQPGNNRMPNLQNLLNEIKEESPHIFELISEGLLSYKSTAGPGPYYPRIRDIIRDVFEKKVNEDRLEYAIWEEASTFYNIKFEPYTQLVIRLLAEATNEVLKAGTNRIPYELNHIKTVLEDVLEKNDRIKFQNAPRQKDAYISYYLEILTNLSFIFPKKSSKIEESEAEKVDELLVFRPKITPEYLLVRALGFETGIEGLNFVLGGGLLLPLDGASAIVSGPSGTGKSTISLLLSLQIALLGGISVYASLETDADIPMRTLVQFRPKEFLNIAYGKSFLEIKDKYKSPYPGILLFPSFIDNFTIDGFLSDLKRYLESIPEDIGNRRFLVIDAVNIIHTNYIKDANYYSDNRPLNPKRRDLMNQCIILAKNYKFSILFIVEQTSGEQFAEHEEFVVDMLFQTDRGLTPGHPRITVVKSRYQPVWQGENALSFNGFSGPEVFPGASCISNALRYRRQPKKEKMAPFWRYSLEGWETYCKNDWWYSPSVTGLIGHKRASKTLLLDTLLSPFLANKIYRKKAIVYVAWGYESLPLRPQLDQSNFQKKTFQFGAQLDNLSRIEKNNPENVAEIFLVFPLRDVQAEQVLWTFYITLKQLSKMGYSIAVTAMNDISILDIDYQWIDVKSNFLPTFIDISQSYKADVIISCSSHENKEYRYTLHHLEHIADNIINLEKVKCGGGDINALSIQRSLDGEHPDGVFEIKTNIHDRLYIARHLKMMDYDSAGRLELIPVNLYLYSETLLQYNFNKCIQATYKLFENDKVDVIFLFPNSIDWNIGASHYIPQKSLKIIQTDGYQLAGTLQISDADKSDSSSIFPYENLSKYESINQLRKTLREDTFPTFNVSAHKKIANQVYAIPYYLNPSFLILPNDLYFNEYDEKDYLKGWDWLIEQALKAKTRQGKKLRLFGCPMVSHENLNTLFLEILAYYLKKKKFYSNESAIDITDRSPKILCEILSHNLMEVYHATVILCQLLADSQWGKSPVPTGDSHLIHLPQDAMFFRSWYTIAHQFIEDINSSNSNAVNRYIIKPLPGKISTRGDWFLTIQSGSISIEDGVNFINELCSQEAAWRRLTSGVGIPPHRAFYEDKKISQTKIPTIGITFEEVDVLLNHSIDRAVFSDYKTIAPKLAYYLENFLIHWKSFGYPQGEICYTPISKDIKEFITYAQTMWEGFIAGG